MTELLDLPDEMILAIFNKVKPQVFLLCSMIDIGNNRLEQLALSKCHSIDLTFNYGHSSYRSLIERFYFYILPYISNNIQSLSLNLIHLLHFDTILKYYNEITFSLTHLKIILCRFHCKSGKQFKIGHVSRNDDHIISDITSISCPNLKELTITCYRNILHYDRFILLFPRLSTVEHLTLLLGVGANRFGLDHFIDGFDLQRNVISQMPHLRQFNFYIRSILKDAPQINIDILRQSFLEQRIQQFVDCTLDYFNNHYGQCQVFSLPFIGTRLDFISNRFPLFDVTNTFSNVTTLLLFDDIKPFEHNFFERVTQALPHLKTLNVFNLLEQEETKNTATKLIVFSHLVALILHDIHMDYAEQFLCRSHLPRLIELFIRNDALLLIIANNDQQAKNNCANVERLRIVEPWIEPTNAHLNFFPSI
ncbi:unnamed protein product [Rotaria sordida]|uniref:F-box domain-containing protein n=1 Tax=Rotaria sordida TaxID=392033 RepID=A0A815N3U0_9BILA|nr:unnamed protein product [Rotaria sordida]